MEKIMLPEMAIKNAYERIIYVNLDKDYCKNIIGDLDVLIYDNSYTKTLDNVYRIFGKSAGAYLRHFEEKNVRIVLEKYKMFSFEMVDIVYEGNPNTYIAEIFLIENDSTDFEFLFTMRCMKKMGKKYEKTSNEYKKITTSLISLYDSIFSINVSKNEYYSIKSCFVTFTGKYDFLHKYFTDLTEESMQMEYNMRFSRESILQANHKEDIYMEHKLIDGTWIYSQIVFIEDTNNNDILAMLLIDKINEKKKREQAFRDIAVGLEAFYDGCAINDLVTGENIIVKSSTPGIEENIPCQIDELLGRHTSFLIHPEDRERFLKTYCLEGMRKRFNNSGQTYTTEVRRKNQNGEYAWIEVSEKTYIDQNTKNLKSFCYYKYIDEIKRMRTAQDNMQRRYVAFLKDTYEKMFEIAYDEDKVYDYKIENGLISFCDSGFNIHDYIEHNCNLFSNVEFHDMIKKSYEYENIKKNNEDKKTIKYDVLRKKGDENYWCSVTLKIYTRSDGAVRVISYIQNIDEEYKEREKTINNIKNAMEEAEQANKAKSVFLAQMSHDIRTPMNAIVGMTSMAKKNINDKEKILDCINKIEISTELLQRLINDVLDMSKIESGEFELRKQSIRFLDVVEHIADIIKPQCMQKNQNFELIIENMSFRHVTSDKLRLEQVLLNVLANAVKFTPENGNIKMTVKESKIELGKCYYTISIKDDGVGISEDFIKKLYEPFAREETSLNNAQKGTGLGMAIVKQIVSKMNGTIDVESKKYSGTTFIITIPMELCDYAQTDELEQQNDKVLYGKKILVVEDIDINMEIIKDFLQEENVKVVEAWNGKEAIDIFSNNKKDSFDLILMDIQMPVMDGYEAAREIRKINKKIPIIAMTANAFMQDIQNALDAGMNEHFPKPIIMKDFIKMIKKYI